MLTLCPLLTAPLGFKSDSLADQFTLTGAARANGLHGEPCCHEFCFGGGGEVHAVLCDVLCVVYQISGQRSSRLLSL